MIKQIANVQHPKSSPPDTADLPRSPNCFQTSPCERSTSYVSKWLESVGENADSTPQMDQTQDADGFTVPQTPASIRSRSRSRTEVDGASVAASDISGAGSGSSRASRRGLVENATYRDINLAANHIYICHPCDPLPEDISGLVDLICRDRDSPGLSPGDITRDRALHDLFLGAAESEVEKYFSTHIFPNPESTDALKRTDRQPMAKRTVPIAASQYKVSNPVPDMLYGYDRHYAFPQQQGQLISMGTEVVANSQNLLYPFFVIEFKGDGPSGGGNLWAATNQCLGGAASCVHMVERLNLQLEQCTSGKASPIKSVAFSIAMSGTEARLFVSWKHDKLRYYMASIKSFLLQPPDHLREFSKYVLNIIDWGGGKRLDDIRSSLDTLREESRRRSSEAAKSRPSPSVEPETSSKRSKSSSRERSRATGSNSPRSNDASEPH